MKKLIALIVALMMVLVSVAAMAEATTLKAGTSPDFPPFESMDDANNVVGFDADLAARHLREDRHADRVLKPPALTAS